MNTSVAGELATAKPDLPQGIAGQIARGLGSPQFGALVALSAALTLGAGLILWTMKPSMVPVYDRLQQQDIADVLDMARAENIPFEVQAGTGLVLVPQDKVNMLRIKLSASGIGSGGSLGLEQLQQEQSLGTSQFIETARYHHALETELSRTISSMRNIDSARVHLALPKQSVFIRDRAKATASVMLKLLPGRLLEDGQVAAITNLVAAGIAYLEPSQVTVVDQYGKLLSSPDDNSTSAETRKQFAYSRQLESLYAKRIETLLAPILGEGNVRATVTADVDFTYNEQTQEIFEPDEAQVRSEQSQEQQIRNGGLAAGVPGALTNQPPAAGNLDGEEEGAEGAADTPLNTSSQVTRNFELDKTISHTRRVPGQIRQVSVAVLVDDKKTVNEEGEVVRTPLTAEEIDRLTQLVHEAIGYNEARGDSVVVMNQSFQPPVEIEAIEEAPIWEQPWVWNAGRQVLIGLSVLLLILMVVRPAMKNLKSGTVVARLDEKTSGAAELALEDGSAAASGQSAGANGSNSENALEPPAQVYGDILNLARAMADEDPKRVARVVKDWVGEANNG
ncbi:flagellar basal-body MS-ring/collar protein FliF [Granulosicoccaceae sp. 1_MG-2023]|nr:flagellar basal-body MS-ring/collar protein FliF [Granulosicoccaceae sp. 1_MG-2023]